MIWRAKWSTCLLVILSVVAECRRDLQPLTRQAKPLARSRAAAEIEKHISELTRKGANRRVPCSEGNSDARSYIASALAKAGVEPAAPSFSRAETWWGRFFDVVEGSVHRSFCPEGIANVVGMVQGTEFPDEAILYVAHYDGATSDRMGQNQYDNAAAVAVGLALASELAASPPERTAVFFFGDAEFGWSNVGKALPMACESPADAPEWVNRTSRGCLLNGGHYPIGIVDWLDRPARFVDPVHLKLAIVADGLGMPAQTDGRPDPIAAIGAETALGLRELLTDSWEPLGPRQFFLPECFITQASLKRSGQSNFLPSIGSSMFLASRGIPTVRYTQPGSEMVKRAGRLQQISSSTTVPKPDATRLSHVYRTMLHEIRHLAASPSLQTLKVQTAQEDAVVPTPCNYKLQNYEDLLAGFDLLKEAAIAAGDHATEASASKFGGKLKEELQKLMHTHDATKKTVDEDLIREASMFLASHWVGVAGTS